jgi:hypothetical protein
MSINIWIATRLLRGPGSVQVWFSQAARLADPNKILATSIANNFVKSSLILIIFSLFFSPC